jgi:peptidoglycan hydrolase CwlO-like protein
LSEEQPAGDTSKQDDIIKTLNEEKKSLQEEMEKLNENLKVTKVSFHFFGIHSSCFAAS